MVANVDSIIWDRLVDPAWSNLTREAAEGVLRIKFQQADIDRMNELAAMAREGSLSAQQQEELDAYLRIGGMISILQSKARLSLRAARDR
jgi:hypothetical protein